MLVTLLLKTGARLSTGEERPRRLKEIPNVRLGGSSRGGKTAPHSEGPERAICVLYPRAATDEACAILLITTATAIRCARPTDGIGTPAGSATIDLYIANPRACQMNLLPRPCMTRTVTRPSFSSSRQSDRSGPPRRIRTTARASHEVEPRRSEHGKVVGRRSMARAIQLLANPSKAQKKVLACPQGWPAAIHIVLRSKIGPEPSDQA